MHVLICACLSLAKRGVHVAPWVAPAYIAARRWLEAAEATVQTTACGIKVYRI